MGLSSSVRVDPIVGTAVAKPSGGHRILAALSEQDAGAWNALVRRVAGSLEWRLSPNVRANRIRHDASILRPTPFLPALRRARRLARHLVRRAPVVVRTDVKDFYPSVNPGALARALEAIGVSPADRSRAADMLDGWGSHGYAGLPVGPDASAVLANAVLRPVDEVIGDRPWLRWVDDYLVAVESEREAELLLERMDRSLARIGLGRSTSKTTVIEGGREISWLTRCSVPNPLNRRP